MTLYESGFSEYKSNYKTIELNNNEKLADKLAKGSDIKGKGIIPPCHINFNAMNVKLTMFDVKASPLNLKLFKKVDSLGEVIKNINSRLINIIKQLNCCNIAETYNDNILPIFEYILDSFVKELVSMTEDIIQEYQTFALVLCAIRPVPGNPWMKGAGYDWLNTFYSIVNGLDEIVKWIINGNVIDIILDPVKKFYDKLSSCSPVLDETKVSQLIKISKFDIETMKNKITNNKLNNWQTKSDIYINISDLDKHKGCNCLFSIFDIIEINLPEKVTINTSSDFSKLESRVLWKNKDKYKEKINEIKKAGKKRDPSTVLELDEVILTNLNINDALIDIKKEDIIINYTDRYDLRKYDGLYNPYTETKFYVPLSSLKILEVTSNPNILFNTETFSFEEYSSNTEPGLYTEIDMINQIKTEYKLFGSVMDDISNAKELIDKNDKRKELTKLISKARYKLMAQINSQDTKLSNEYNILKKDLKNKISKTSVFTQMTDMSSNSISLIKEMGISFNPMKFVSLIKQGKISVSSFDVDEYLQLSNTYDLLLAAEDRLNKLIIYDNCKIELVGQFTNECGCDIICKLIQLLVDMILSAVSEITNTIVKNVINACLNEKVSYIIKFILDKYQCFLNAKELRENKERIKKLSDYLHSKYELKDHGAVDSDGNSVDTINGLRRMVDMNCSSPDDAGGIKEVSQNIIDLIIEKSDNDVIDQTILNPNDGPDTTDETVDANNTNDNSSTTDTNNNDVSTTSDSKYISESTPNFSYSGLSIGDMRNNRNIPELTVVCTDTNNPAIKIIRK